MSFPGSRRNRWTHGSKRAVSDRRRHECSGGRPSRDLRSLPLARGLEILDDAEALVTRSVPATSPWHRAVEMAVDRRHPVYDTLFVALAEAERTKLVTRDARLRERYPELVQ